MTDESQTPPEKSQKRPFIGYLLNIIALIISVASILWQMWLLPIVDDLSKQGRMHEGDSDGCFYGMLMVPTYFIVPLIAVIAFILGIFGFRLRARTLAVIVWIVALLSLIPMRSAWLEFFGG